MRILEKMGIKTRIAILIILIFTALFVSGWINLKIIREVEETERLFSQKTLALRYLEKLRESAENLQADLISFKGGKIPEIVIKRDLVNIETAFKILRELLEVDSELERIFSMLINSTGNLTRSSTEDLLNFCVSLTNDFLKTLSDRIRSEEGTIANIRIGFESSLKRDYRISTTIFVITLIVATLSSMLVMKGIKDCMSSLIGYLEHVIKQIGSESFPVKPPPVEKPSPEVMVIIKHVEKLVESLNRSIKRIKELSEAKTAFLAIVSHELRTPLTPIIGFSELLLQEKLSAEAKENLKIIASEARKLSNIIDRMLTYSRLDSPPELRKVRLKTLILDEAENIKRPAEEKKLKLIIELPKEDVITETDPHRIRIGLREILSNAVKFTKEGYVKISLKICDRNAIITVEDSGIGIEREKSKIIFELFTQTESFLRRKHEGMGLGLALAQRAIQSIGGNISFKSEPGKGSEFSIKIPLKGGEKIDKYL